MKKWLVFLLGLLMVGVMFVSAYDDASDPGFLGLSDGSDGAEADAEEMTETIGKYSPLDDEGEVDWGKYDPFVTKAEERIIAINLWLDENVGWMRYFFHMRPALSLLFFVNVYVILWFFIAFVLNAGGLWFFIEKEKSARIFGGGVFFILLVVKLYYGLASVLTNWFLYFWFVLAEASIWMAIIGFAAWCFLMYFGIIVWSSIGVALMKYKTARDAAHDKMEMKTSTEAMKVLIDEVGK